MSKDEITLELVKLSYNYAIKEANSKGNFDTAKIISDLYKNIYNSIKEPEQNK